MITASLPENEAERLATLHALQILDTPFEERFDRITRLATRLFDIPIAVVTLVDADRVWFKAVEGLAIQETPRDVSFCPHAILADDTFVVEDLREDPCFSGNPFVTEPPHLQFYGGHPLRASNGHKVGIFCLLDTRPRRFSDAERQTLRDLAAMVENELNSLAMSQALLQQVEQLREANLRLTEADRYKDEFLSVISHELRTPLNFITGFASILEEEVEGPLNPGQRHAVGKILTGSDRMLALVDDLLDVARIRAGQLSLTRTDFAPQALVDEAIAALAPIAAGKGLALRSDASAAPAWSGDVDRLGQVIMNLVSNALKFTDAGAVTVRARAAHGQLRFEVHDTGCGISAQDQERLFGRFQQLDMSITRKAGGTGLGLAICKAIVEAHGGAIGVESEPGQGATFWFTLPRPPAASGEAEVWYAAPLPSDECDRLAALRDLGVLDTPPDPRFDRLTRLVARHFNVPYVAVSLIDADRQWFKSRHGLDVNETPRDTSFCAHAILEPAPMVVCDTHRDARFRSHPAVVGAPHLRFYAAHVITSPEGHRLGTLCISDTAPRAFDAADTAALTDFGRLVEQALFDDEARMLRSGGFAPS